MSAAQALTEAAFALLDTALSVPVHDAVPVDATFPYVVIGPIRSSGWRADGMAGEAHAVEIHVWSRYRGAKQVRSLMEGVRAALDGAAPNLTGHHLVLLAFTGAADERARDGITRHGVVRFRALTEPAAS